MNLEIWKILIDLLTQRVHQNYQCLIDNPSNTQLALPLLIQRVLESATPHRL
jgi:hypothetical protein